MMAQVADAMRVNAKLVMAAQTRIQQILAERSVTREVTAQRLSEFHAIQPTRAARIIVFEVMCRALAGVVIERESPATGGSQ